MNRYQEVLSREFDRYRKMLTYDTNDLVVLETSRVAINKNDDYDLDTACVSQNQPLEELVKPDNDEIARYLAQTRLEATQYTESGNNDSDDDSAERRRRVKGKQPQKRPYEAVKEDDKLLEIPVDGSMLGRLGRIRK
ncbi:hypothetical protein N7536_005760 [Penicillium majusculum]|nr:hypothetical protein N7536_005760 [Penicillium majusculum]